MLGHIPGRPVLGEGKAMLHYCHNCHYYRELPDTVFCDWCQAFFYAHGRLPVAADREPSLSSPVNPFTTIARLWAEIESMK